MTCEHCGTALPDAAKFCFECGRPVAPAGVRFASPHAYTPRHLADKILTSRAALEGERKQVTVLFCDIVNSTALAERIGPEAMHALLNRFFDLSVRTVHYLEGTVNQFLGDGFMALFGAPVAHEDHAQRAIRAALGLKRQLRLGRDALGLPEGVELETRMGLNTGPVVVGSIGDNLRMDYTAVGDTTNVAARLQHVAAPGAILLAESTARLVQGDARLEPAGPLTVKGKREPIVAWQLRGLAPGRHALDRVGEQAASRFVGRDRELGQLQARWAAVEAGEGGAVCVVGEAGAGKSRLVYEFRQTLAGKALTLLEGRCRSYGGTIPLLPIIDLVRSLGGVAELDAPQVVVDKVRHALAELGIDPEERAPYLLQLLGVKDGTDGLGDLSAEAISARTVDTLGAMLRTVAARRPLVLLLEDLHRIDGPSESYLGALIDGLEDARILLVTTARPEYRAAWRSEECAGEIVLKKLDIWASLGLVRSVARSPLPEDVERAILDRAGGNPLFLEELTRAVSERPAGNGALTVPDTIQGVVMARIDRLPEATKRFLQTASVLGREFPLRLIEAVWPGPGRPEAHLAELTRLDLLHERVEADEPRYAFASALTQEVAYDSLLTGHRQALHEAAAEALEALYAGRLERVDDRLAYHYARTQRADRAIHYLSRVADRAARAYANAEAAHALEEAETHARRLGSGGERARVELLLRRLQTMFLLGQFRESLELMIAATPDVAALGDDALTAELYLQLASVYGVLGEGRAAQSFARETLALAGRADDARLEGRARYILARESFWAGQLAQGIEHGRRAVRLLEATGDRFYLSLSHWTMALNYFLLGRCDEALESTAWAQAAADKLADPRLATNAARASDWIHATMGDWATGVEAGRRAL